LTYYTEQSEQRWRNGFGALWRSFYRIVAREFFIMSIYARLSDVLLTVATRLNVLLRWA
jgi:NADH-quinone oxidoreductase subunit L